MSTIHDFFIILYQSASSSCYFFDNIYCILFWFTLEKSRSERFSVLERCKRRVYPLLERYFAFFFVFFFSIIALLSRLWEHSSAARRGLLSLSYHRPQFRSVLFYRYQAAVAAAALTCIRVALVIRETYLLLVGRVIDRSKNQTSLRCSPAFGGTLARLFLLPPFFAHTRLYRYICFLIRSILPSFLPYSYYSFPFSSRRIRRWRRRERFLSFVYILFSLSR